MTLHGTIKLHNKVGRDFIFGGLIIVCLSCVVLQVCEIPLFYLSNFSLGSYS